MDATHMHAEHTQVYIRSYHASTEIVYEPRLAILRFGLWYDSYHAPSDLINTVAWLTDYEWSSTGHVTHVHIVSIYVPAPS